MEAKENPAMQKIPRRRAALIALTAFLCSTGVASPTASAEEWAAVARSKSNPAIYGWASRQPAPADADRIALAACAKQARDCDIEGLFDDICNGYASNGREVFMATGKTEAIAGAATLRECRKIGDKNCKLHFALCPWKAKPVIKN